jgi:hypothetical protein
MTDYAGLVKRLDDFCAFITIEAARTIEALVKERNAVTADRQAAMSEAWELGREAGIREALESINRTMDRETFTETDWDDIADVTSIRRER